MFKRNDDNYLISIIPRFSITLENMNNLTYFDELIDVRDEEDYFLDHVDRPEVKRYCALYRI